jgi:hypothetical protein
MFINIFAKMKILNYILLALIYTLFVLDRIILSILSRHLPSFVTWAELHYSEENRTYENVLKSLVRVCCALFALLLFVLIKLL